MIKLKSKYFKRNKSYEQQDTNPPRKAHNNMRELWPILSVLFFAQTVAITSIFSQTAFLMIANVFLSLGFLIVIGRSIYVKAMNKKIASAVVDAVLTLALIVGLFFILLSFTPIITNSSLIFTLSFVNLFATSVNTYMILRYLALPPIFSGLQKLSDKFKLGLDFQFERAPDFTIHNSFVHHYYSKDVYMDEPAWKEKAIKPLNNSKEMNFFYINKYLSSPLGAIDRAGEIKERRSSYEAMVNTSKLENLYTTFFKNKLIYKAEKIKKIRLAIDEISTKCDKTTLQRYFDLSGTDKSFIKESGFYIKILEKELDRQYKKTLSLLQCYPLHIALERLNNELRNIIPEPDLLKLKAELKTEEALSIYANDADQFESIKLR